LKWICLTISGMLIMYSCPTLSSKTVVQVNVLPTQFVFIGLDNNNFIGKRKINHPRKNPQQLNLLYGYGGILYFCFNY